MYNKILVLGAAGQIGSRLTNELLKQTDMDLVLYGRNLSDRLDIDNDRVQIMDGTFGDADLLTEAIQDVDLVYVNAMDRPNDIRVIEQVLATKPGIKMIGASMAGVHNEVPEALTKFTRENLPKSYIDGEIESAKIIEGSDIDFTLLHLTWLYDDASNLNYELVPEPEEFKDAEVTREAVVQAIIDIITDANQEQYKRKCFGVGEPNTHYDKPSFY